MPEGYQWIGPGLAAWQRTPLLRAPLGSLRAAELWSLALDGSDERLESAIGLFCPIDRAFTVSRDHVAAWANFHTGRHEVWTAVVK